MNSWRQQEAGTVNAEPGVQVYEDPDPQASPLDPAYEAGGLRSRRSIRFRACTPARVG